MDCSIQDCSTVIYGVGFSLLLCNCSYGDSGGKTDERWDIGWKLGCRVRSMMDLVYVHV